MTPANLLLVFIGSGLGGMARYATTLGAARTVGLNFPWGTLAVNLVGGLLIGLLSGFWVGQGASPSTRLFLVTGILGGYTTFSAFTLDTMTLLERQQTGLAIAYILASVCGAMLAFAAGQGLGRTFGA